MAKRKETLEIEEKLHYMCHKKRIYGCEEMTIGFANAGQGNEIVDYCTMDSKGILRCYEIKVTLPDLKSKAKKSWYGHYNYLVVTNELYQKIRSEIETFIPEFVGVAVPCSASWSCGIEIKRNAKKQKLSPGQEIMLKESLIRSMYYKKEKYKNASDIEKVKQIKADCKEWEKRYRQEYQERNQYLNMILRYELANRRLTRRKIDFESVVTDLEQKAAVKLRGELTEISENAEGKVSRKEVLEQLADIVIECENLAGDLFDFEKIKIERKRRKQK